MRLGWVRGTDKVDFTRPDVWFCLGQRGSGKSSFLETVGEEFLKGDNHVLDLFGSRDGEALAWLRSPWVKDRKVLLVKGENVDVKSSYETRSAEAVSVSDFERYDLIITASPLFLNVDQEFTDAAIIEDRLYQRLHWKNVVYLCCREASNFYYSRLKVSENQVFAKAEMVYLLRESRHMGIALGLDSVRSFAIDIDIRSLADYLILKAQGVQGLSRDLKWLYGYIDPNFLRKLNPARFMIVTKRGAIGYGDFEEIQWHKQEREDILNAVGIEVEYGEKLVEPIYKGTYKTVGDVEHSQIMRLYDMGELSMNKIGEQMNRSSRTVDLHIEAHNYSVKTKGFCPVCKRAQSQLAYKQLGHGFLLETPKTK
jgi:hypothetical protein